MTGFAEDRFYGFRQESQTRSVVTAIEVLSPTNKTRGSRGRASYFEKRRDSLRSEAHLIEIDLLRAVRAGFHRAGVAVTRFI